MTITANNVQVQGQAVFTSGTHLGPFHLDNLTNAFSGGTFGTMYFDLAVYPDAAIIPVGAIITSSTVPGWSSQVRTVLTSQAWVDPQYWQITYDATGLTGSTSTSDTFSFNWYSLRKHH